jgi:hypothetical protein
MAALSALHGVADHDLPVTERIRHMTSTNVMCGRVLYQNFPNRDTKAKNDDGTPMHNWCVYLFY